MNQMIGMVQRRRRTKKTADAVLSEELRDGLVIFSDYSLYFSNFKTCIMPGQNAHAESDEENYDRKSDTVGNEARHRPVMSAYRRRIGSRLHLFRGGVMAPGASIESGGRGIAEENTGR